ncbi:dihydrolipoamide acetyltransferase family protein [Streptomyces sp. NPDC046977]|uniref:dihydrolipoamide acetyltransferase family protein n=1 Tax=Streptomyces sp. NPDC046977 TaxID=3154703 RepID=UPI0033CDEFCD
MPDVGEGLTEAEILKWYVKPGDTVTDGQVVCEVETAKAAVELPIPFDGIVHELRFPEGETVDVGTVIISVDTGQGEAEEAPAAAAAPAQAADAPVQDVAAEPEQKRQPVLVGYGVAVSSTKRRPRKQAAVPAQGAAGAIQAELNGHAPAAVPAAVPAEPVAPAALTASAAGFAPTEARPLAKPPVRKLAKNLGVDLAGITPTGPQGTITREDVQNAVAPAAPAAPAVPAAPVAPAAVRTAPAAAATSTAPLETRVPIKGVRKATAAAMVASAFTAPHVTEFVTFDITRTMRLVQELKTDPAFTGLKVGPLLLVAKALLVAIRRNPEINAAWDEANQEIVHKGYVNLGIAAATPRGLIVPNIKDAQAKTLPELAASLGDLVATAREGKTSPADMQGGTVTITNVGVFGIDTGTPILNPGESAILAFGAVKDMPWVHKGKVKPRQVTTLALSFDHRLVDGELGSKVLADVAAVLEYPKRLMTWA